MTAAHTAHTNTKHCSCVCWRKPDDLKKKQQTTLFQEKWLWKAGLLEEQRTTATPDRGHVAEKPWAHQVQVCKVLRDMRMLKTVSEPARPCVCTAKIGSLCFLRSWALTWEHLKLSLVHRVEAAVLGNKEKCSNNEKCFSICHCRPVSEVIRGASAAAHSQPVDERL